MQIEALKMFCDAADLKSVTRAAEANFVTQSAVSQQIRQLEKAWKARLLERGRRGMALTRAGEIVYRESRAILERYEAMRRLLGKQVNVISGSVRVATIYSIGLHELQPTLKRFFKQYPQVNVHVEYEQNSKIYEQVLSQRADLGIVSYPAAKPGLEVLPFHEDRLVVVCDPRHPFARRKTLSLAKIQGERFIGFEEEVPTRRAIDQALREEGVGVKMVMEFDNIETLKRAVEIGAGISIIPQETVWQELEHGTLKAVGISGRKLVRPLGILARKGRVLPAQVSKFLSFLLPSSRRGTPSAS